MSTQRVYAIGDIHGHLAKLQDTHGLIYRDMRANGPGQVVHIGDFVDRGPDSKGVIDYLISGAAEGRDWVNLKGNHDRMMALYLQASPQRDHRLRAEFDWLHPRLGGLETLESYGVDTALGPDAVHREALGLVPGNHLEFLSGLDTCHAVGDLLFAHAGIRPGVPLDEQTEDDLLWIRDEFHFSMADHGALVIHGHTPVEEVLHYGNRVNIDTGAAYGGPLSAVVIEDGTVYAIEKRGRRKISSPRR